VWGPDISWEAGSIGCWVAGIASVDEALAQTSGLFRQSRLRMKKFVLGLIRLYQRYVSPMTPPSCRYVPTCSQYAVEAVSKYGAMKGSWLAMKRISRCHPFHEGGYDPVP